MKLRIEKEVVVITPTIGTPALRKATESVREQTYKNIKHLVVVDGPQYWLDAMSNVDMIHEDSKVQLTVTPENTGKTGGDFWGHRIYAAYPHLVNADYVFFLDEDNWYEPNHVVSLIDKIEEKNYDWAYSLRKIVSKEGEFIIDDCCESLGKWPVFWSTEQNRQPEYLIDTSAYAFKREFLIQVCSHWHYGWGGDRRFYKILTENYKHTNFDTTGLHTLNYRLDDALEKKYGSLDFFTKGNEILKQYYFGEYPWLKKI